MALMHQSVSTIKQPEFINLTQNDINPGITNCDIKVLYIGENRNRSYISKEVATEMAKSLRGTPIVGHYIESKEDFSDHGDQIIIDGEGVKFNKLTTPYGFVATDAKVWFQTFVDDGQVEKEYLMTQGYLWTTQFKECASILKEDKGQSMEIENLEGEWTKAINNNYELFIINDATFSKLCILGDDVEPCFEGASISAAKDYNLMDNNFRMTLFSMIEDMKKIKEGSEKSMESELNAGAVTETAEAQPIQEEASLENTETTAAPEVENLDNPNESTQENNEEGVENNGNENQEVPVTESEEYQLLLSKYNALEEENATLKAQNADLLSFKSQVENEKKDELINSFYMLSDEDKKDVLDNKTKYSYDEIEAKLSVICVRNKVSFAQKDNDTRKEPVVYNLNGQAEESVPAWLKAIDDAHNNSKKI